MDPAQASYQAAWWACSLVFSTLTEYDSSLLLQPGIAREWSVSEDGKRWEFRLRTDVYFQRDSCFGGLGTRRLVARDVKYSVERILDARTKSPGLWVFRKRLTGAEEFYQLTKSGKAGDGCSGIEVTDDSTIVFHLVKPFAPFASLLAMPYCGVVPHEALQRYGLDFGRHPVGSGAFQFLNWKVDVELDLIRNPSYFKVDDRGERLPYLNSVSISFIKDLKTEFMEFRKSKLDFVSGLDPAVAPAVVNPDGSLREGFKHLRVQQVPAMIVEYYGILVDTNFVAAKQTPLSRDVRVRKALNYAIDRERIVRYVLNGKGLAAQHGVLPPGTPGFSKSVRGYDYDPEKARSLLDAAGYKDGVGFPKLTLQMGNNQRTASVGEAVQQMWKEIGISMDIKMIDFPQHLDMVRSGRLALWRTSWIGDYPDPENFLSLFSSEYWSPNGPNTTHYRNSEVDSLYNEALSPKLSTAQRLLAYSSLEKRVVDDCPWIFLYYNVLQRLVQPGVEGLPIDASDRLVLERVRKKGR